MPEGWEALSRLPKQLHVCVCACACTHAKAYLAMNSKGASTPIPRVLSGALGAKLTWCVCVWGGGGGPVWAAPAPLWGGLRPGGGTFWPSWPPCWGA